MPGLYFEEFAVGDEFTSPGRTITETDIANFAGVSGDFNPLHTDEEFARQTPFGGRIAHGVLGLAVLTGLRARLGINEGTVLAFLGLTWSFRGPIRPGDTVHARIRIAEARPTSKPDRGLLTQHVELVNQRGEVVQEGDHVLLMRRRPVAAGAEKDRPAE